MKEDKSGDEKVSAMDESSAMKSAPSVQETIPSAMMNGQQLNDYSDIFINSVIDMHEYQVINWFL